MTALHQQIINLFEDTEPDIRELISKVLEIEKEFLHLENPIGIMDRINEALEDVAATSIQSETHE